MTTVTEPTEKAGRAKARTDITYFHDGRAMPGSHKHKLSTLAYFHSGNLDGDKPRVGTKEFVKILTGLGVENPGEPGWLVKLPNGVTVECRADGDKPTFDGPVPERKSAAKAKPAKAPAKKPAKATARVRKETAKAKAARKAPAAKRTATPIPKGQPQKRRPSRAN